MTTKTYINWISAKKITGKFWDFYSISLNYEKLKEYCNEKWYINMNMSPRKEAGKYGETESFTLNTWEKPKEQTKTHKDEIDDLPFN